MTTSKKKSLVDDIGSKIKSEITQLPVPEVEIVKNLNTKETSYVEQQLDNLLKIEQIREKKNLNDNLKQDRDLRRSYANKLFVLTCIWISIIFIILFLIGFKVMILSDKVLIILITSTTATFLGLFTLVIRYLFNVPSGKNWFEREKK